MANHLVECSKNPFVGHRSMCNNVPQNQDVGNFPHSLGVVQIK